MDTVLLCRFFLKRKLTEFSSDVVNKKSINISIAKLPNSILRVNRAFLLFKLA